MQEANRQKGFYDNGLSVVVLEDRIKKMREELRIPDSKARSVLINQYYDINGTNSDFLLQYEKYRKLLDKKGHVQNICSLIQENFILAAHYNSENRTANKNIRDILDEHFNVCDCCKTYVLEAGYEMSNLIKISTLENPVTRKNLFSRVPENTIQSYYLLVLNKVKEYASSEGKLKFDDFDTNIGMILVYFMDQIKGGNELINYSHLFLYDMIRNNLINLYVENREEIPDIMTYDIPTEYRNNGELKLTEKGNKYINKHKKKWDKLRKKYVILL